MSDLKPCPFCGGEAEVRMRHDSVFGVDWYRAQCVNEHLGSEKTSKDKAITAWNTRPDTLGWQTVETAPSSGPKVWVFGRFHKEPELALPDGDFWRYRKKEGGASIEHWMPQVIPKPPEVTT